MGYRRYSEYDYEHNGRRYQRGYGRPGKSDAYYMDGGANDEGYYYTYCSICDEETEHDPSSGCCECY